MHRLTASILDVSNAFQNKNLLIYERLCVITPPFYIDWFEKSYPNVTLNRNYGTCCILCMNVIQGGKPAGWKWYRLLDAVVTIIKYKIITIYHDIYIKVFSDGTVSYLTVSTDDIIKNTNNDIVFPELRIFLKKLLRLNSKKYLSLST